MQDKRTAPLLLKEAESHKKIETRKDDLYLYYKNGYYTIYYHNII